ncbi:probable aspartic proteinase GIP2 [Humulus lupulus]|uniref:probable aspartic proteinase GIP2 n=1 Tax=Humulus lupulus TaxID=3486 RepID=UPI002B4087CF|nr:probable aspartic proteinase GIP2 [Humulus lupulus]
MSSNSFHHLLFCSLLLLIISPSISQTISFRPKALVLQVTKDSATHQYYTHITQRTPPVQIKVAIDLGGEFLWVDCEKGYNSSTKKPVPCRSAQCNLAKSNACSINGNQSEDVCGEFPHNPFISTITSGELSQDIIYIQSTNGSRPGKVVSVPKFIFTCAPTFISEGLASGAVGVAGLGRNTIALPSLFSAAFSFPKKLAVCLSSTNGVVFFGNSPYELSPGIDVSKSLTYTPLIRNPVNLIGGSVGESSSEYFIGVKSIKVDGKPVSVNSSLLSFDVDGNGGTKISTVDPYTTLETSIYNTVVNAFVNALAVRNVHKVAAVAPFGACFNAKDIGLSRAGPMVPPIEFVLQSEKVVWRVTGANSMVRVSNEVLCLGFVDGGPLHFVGWGIKSTPTAIVIGGHQIEDNLLQFDLATSRLGFSSSLLSRQLSCSNFKFN